MKRLLCFLLIILTLLSFASCGKKKSETPAPQTQSQSVPKEPINHRLSSQKPAEGLKLVDASGKVWFETAEIDLVVYRYFEKIGRYLQIEPTAAAQSKIKSAEEEKITEFTAVIGEQEYAKFKIYTDDDGNKMLIYPDKADPVMQCYNDIT